MVQFHVILSHYPGYDPYEEEPVVLARYEAALTIVNEGPETVPAEELAACDILLNLGWDVSAPLMDRMPRLRHIALYGIGTDAVDLAAATERGIVVTNAPLGAVDDVANHAVALLMASIRRIPTLDAAVRRGDYNWDLLRPAHNPRGKTLGLVAFGNIARAVAAKMACAFGMRVIAYDPYVSAETAAQHDVRLTSLEEVMRESDLISVHAPRTPETRCLIGERELRLMKSSAHLAVTSRGGVIDEAALVRALREGLLAGAALDVQAREPLPLDDPLLEAPNLILTPHCAGYSEEGNIAVKRTALEAACRVLEGRWPSFVVNKGVRPRYPLAE